MTNTTNETTVGDLYDLLGQYPHDAKIRFSIANDETDDPGERWFVENGIYEPIWDPDARGQESGELTLCLVGESNIKRKALDNQSMAQTDMASESEQSSISRLLSAYQKEAKSNVDRALYNLLTRFEDELPPLNNYFHKAFRQIDCVDTRAGGYMDMAIWFLLNESELFWELFEEYTE